MWFGAGRGAQHAVIALVGSGVGAAVVGDGSSYRGSRSSAGEWGHTTIVYGGRPCRCGARGCLEAYVGRGGDPGPLSRGDRDGAVAEGTDEESAIGRAVAAAETSRPRRCCPRPSAISAPASPRLINLFNPERIVLGGWAGLALGARLLPEIRPRRRSTRCASRSRRPHRACQLARTRSRSARRRCRSLTCWPTERRRTARRPASTLSRKGVSAEEIVDVVDVADRVVGTGAAGRRCTRAGCVHRCVFVLCPVTAPGRVFVHRRTPTTSSPPRPGTTCSWAAWSAPARATTPPRPGRSAEELGVSKATSTFLFRFLYRDPAYGSWWSAVYELRHDGPVHPQESEIAWHGLGDRGRAGPDAAGAGLDSGQRRGVRAAGGPARVLTPGRGRRACHPPSGGAGGARTTTGRVVGDRPGQPPVSVDPAALPDAAWTPPASTAGGATRPAATGS